MPALLYYFFNNTCRFVVVFLTYFIIPLALSFSPLEGELHEGSGFVCFVHCHIPTLRTRPGSCSCSMGHLLSELMNASELNCQVKVKVYFPENHS